MKKLSFTKLNIENSCVLSLDDKKKVAGGANPLEKKWICLSCEANKPPICMWLSLEDEWPC